MSSPTPEEQQQKEREIKKRKEKLLIRCVGAFLMFKKWELNRAILIPSAALAGVCVRVCVFADVRSNSRYYWNLLVHVWPRAQTSLWIRIAAIHLGRRSYYLSLPPPPRLPAIKALILFSFCFFKQKKQSEASQISNLVFFSSSPLSLGYENRNQVIGLSQQLLPLTRGNNTHPQRKEGQT